MTRRDRLARKLDKRLEWAGKAHGRSEAAFAGAHRIADGIPMGQPILVGHHSEKRARRDQQRIHDGMNRGVTEHRLAENHESKARGLAVALERSIFDDDPDAIERLTAKIADLEANCETMTRANKLWRKGGQGAVAAEFGESLAHAAATVMAQGYSWIKSPFNLTSDRAEIRRCRARIEAIQRQRQRASEAHAAGGVMVRKVPESDWCVVTFAEKPDRDVLGALRSAGYRWGQGSWHGRLSMLPSEIEELRKAAAGECLCSTADAYLCLPCERAQSRDADE